MSEKTTDTGPPIGNPSICFIKREFTEKTHSFVNFTNNFLKTDLLQKGLINLSTYILCKIYSIVSLTGMFVKSQSTSSETSS